MLTGDILVIKLQGAQKTCNSVIFRENSLLMGWGETPPTYPYIISLANDLMYANIFIGVPLFSWNGSPNFHFLPPPPLLQHIRNFLPPPLAPAAPRRPRPRHPPTPIVKCPPFPLGTANEAMISLQRHVHQRIFQLVCHMQHHLGQWSL